VLIVAIFTDCEKSGNFFFLTTSPHPDQDDGMPALFYARPDVTAAEAGAAVAGLAFPTTMFVNKGPSTRTFSDPILCPISCKSDGDTIICPT
jgi:hypothetical protein